MWFLSVQYAPKRPPDMVQVAVLSVAACPLTCRPLSADQVLVAMVSAGEDCAISGDQSMVSFLTLVGDFGSLMRHASVCMQRLRVCGLLL